MEGGSQIHSPHYHCLHYAESDALRITHGDQTRVTPEEEKWKGKQEEGMVCREHSTHTHTHRSTAHKTHKNNRPHGSVQLKDKIKEDSTQNVINTNLSKCNLCGKKSSLDFYGHAFSPPPLGL